MTKKQKITCYCVTYASFSNDNYNLYSEERLTTDLNEARKYLEGYLKGVQEEKDMAGVEYDIRREERGTDTEISVSSSDDTYSYYSIRLTKHELN